jgi:hypothetical protein
MARYLLYQRVNCGPGYKEKSQSGAFYHNNRDGTVSDVTRTSGLARAHYTFGGSGRTRIADDHSRCFPQYYSERRRPQIGDGIVSGPVIEEEVNDLTSLAVHLSSGPAHGGEIARLCGSAAIVFQRGARRASLIPSPTGTPEALGQGCRMCKRSLLFD